MRFNPFSDRNSNQMFDETDEIGFTILFAGVVVIGLLLLMKVQSKDAEQKFLQQNNCIIEEYDVKSSMAHKKTLWLCDGNKHYVSDYVSQ